MKYLLSCIALTISFSCLAQEKNFNNKEYSASNGITYHVGDTLTIAKGSGTDGKFLFMSLTGFKAMMSYDDTNSNGADQLLAGRAYAGARGVLKKIKQMKFAGNIKPYFIIDFKAQGNYMLLVEDAIGACEIKPCNM